MPQKAEDGAPRSETQNASAPHARTRSPLPARHKTRHAGRRRNAARAKRAKVAPDERLNANSFPRNSAINFLLQIKTRNAKRSITQTRCISHIPHAQPSPSAPQNASCRQNAQHGARETRTFLNPYAFQRNLRIQKSGSRFCALNFSRALYFLRAPEHSQESAHF